MLRVAPTYPPDRAPQQAPASTPDHVPIAVLDGLLHALVSSYHFASPHPLPPDTLPAPDTMPAPPAGPRRRLPPGPPVEVMILRVTPKQGGRGEHRKLVDNVHFGAVGVRVATTTPRCGALSHRVSRCSPPDREGRVCQRAVSRTGGAGDTHGGALPAIEANGSSSCPGVGFLDAQPRAAEGGCS